MKNIDFEKVDNLELLKKNFNEVIEEHISRAKNKLAMSESEKMDVGELKYIFENVSDGLYETNEGKKVIRKYVKTIRENKALKNFYTLFETIKNVRGVNDSTVFLSEAVKLSRTIPEIERKKLSRVVREAVYLSNKSIDEINSLMEAYDLNIDKPISFILLEKSTPKNVLEYSNSVQKVSDMLGDRCMPVNENTESSKDIVDKINNLVDESYEQWERDVIRDISLYTVANKDKSDLFETYKGDCLKLLNETLDNCESVEEKSRFTTMSENLTNKMFNEETFSADIMKLSELRETLKSNL